MSRVATPNAKGDGELSGNAVAESTEPRRALPSPEDPSSSHPTDSKKESTPEKPAENKGNENKTPLYKKPLFWIIASIVVIVGTIVGVLWWLDVRYKVSTDDAFISAHATTVSPRVSGHVEEVKVDDNQEVKKGDLLLVLDERDFMQQLRSAQASMETAKSQVVQATAQLASAQAQVAQAQADVSAAQASADQAQSDLQRYLEAQKTDARAVSKQQVDQANATARTTKAQLESNIQKKGAAESQIKVADAQIVAGQAMVDKAQSDIDNAKLQLSYTRIYAAEDGQVTNRSVEVGNYVTPGQAMMALVPRNVWVTANFKETQLKEMREGQPVKIHIDAYGMDLSGHVQSIQAGSGSAFSLLPPENATGNYVKVVQRLPVKITIDELPQRRLSPGMSVEPTVDITPR